MEIASDTSEHSVRLGLKLFIVSENCPGMHDNKKSMEECWYFLSQTTSISVCNEAHDRKTGHFWSKAVFILLRIKKHPYWTIAYVNSFTFFPSKIKAALEKFFSAIFAGPNKKILGS